MSTTVARLYESYGNALEASNGLRKRGFNRDEIVLISRAANNEAGEIPDLPAEISQAGIPADDVASYVASIDGGKSLLVVRAAWGSAQKAIGIVDNHGPSDTDVGNREYYVSTTENPANFSLSSYLGFPVLLLEAAPFSKFWNLPVLFANSAPFSSFFSFPLLSKGFTFGVPKLISNGSAFSDELKIPVLMKDKWEK